jgi:glycosyltransferase involved in cell wall biosynthesis
VLYVSAVDVSVGNGPGVNEREFIHAFHGAMGERAHFLVPRPTESVDDLSRQALTFCLPHRRYNPLLFPFHVISQIRAGSRLLRERHFDLLIVRIDVLPLVPFYLTRRHRLPYVIKTLGTGALNVLDEHGGCLGKALAPLHRLLFRRLVAGALVADTDSQLHAEDLRRRLDQRDQKIVWIDNAVNTQRFFPSSQAAARRELGLAEFDPVIGYVGTRPWERGGAQLLEAAARLRAKHLRLGVVIVGAGKLVAAMKRRATELGLAERCHFAGYVPYRKIPLYMNSLDVGVSINLKPGWQLNSELKVRQYLACGTPIVISPGSNEFVQAENFGTVVESEDLGAITQAIERWLALRPAEREAFSARAARYMHERLSMAAAIEQRICLWTERMQA